MERDETGSFEKISESGRVLWNTSAMTAEREALRMGVCSIMGLKIQVEQYSTNLMRSLCVSSVFTVKRE